LGWLLSLVEILGEGGEEGIGQKDYSHHRLAERDNGLARQEEDRDVDTGDVFAYPVSKGFVEMVSILFT
jgi:hypothetical protein